MGNVIGRVNAYRRQLKHLSDVFEGRVPKVLILGLDGAGKTCLMYKTKLDHTIYANLPPRGINIEHTRPRRGARIQLYDMPGSKLSRYLWQAFLKEAEAIVWVVDSSDRVRADEAKFELHDLLQSRSLRRVPVIVVANKQDADGVMGPEQVRTELDLASIQDRDVTIHGVSAKNGTNVKAVFVDVVDKIKAYRHFKSSLQSPKPDHQNGKNKNEINGIEFTNIETKDANENIPSLFENLKKREQVTDVDNEIDVVPGPSGVQSEQAVYAGHSVDDADYASNYTADNPTPDSLSLAAQSIDDMRKESKEIGSNESVRGSAVDTGSRDFSDIDSRDTSSRKSVDERVNESLLSNNSEKDCVKHLEDIVREHGMEYV
ncbi:uncharacterized protein LOC127853362 isoform X1 [Dreissena polymorpha]|uniref:Uncharacterized protein n=1 Tax=Dreissena polymorpha TaxID=45954 RepID=A0A9D4CPR3_DREPO|nr:uncharacterized protein LOC127853362 isoform X1 [Dreissena polymorpha]KAH3729345.1 hypothetical protein DPMN_055313 [Dreissena polymorpha]